MRKVFEATVTWPHRNNESKHNRREKNADGFHAPCFFVTRAVIHNLDPRSALQFNPEPSPQLRLRGISYASRKLWEQLTIQSGVVWLNMHSLDLAVFANLNGITLASWATENSTTIESQIQCFGKFGCWVSEETDL